MAVFDWIWSNSTQLYFQVRKFIFSQYFNSLDLINQPWFINARCASRALIVELTEEEIAQHFNVTLIDSDSLKNFRGRNALIVGVGIEPIKQLLIWKEIVLISIWILFAFKWKAFTTRKNNS